MTVAHDLLVDPILSWRDVDRRREMTTLPGIVAKLAARELVDYPRVRPHQFHPWSMFLTQLAAIALRRAGKSDPPVSEDVWRDLLLGLTAGAREPWCLVVEDLSSPAFLQPPIPEATSDWALAEEWRKHAQRPDEIDILVTSKGHDVKESRLDGAVPEYWVYALVTLQTAQGVYGSGKYGVARMKRGYGNRPRVGLVNSPSPAARFLRDLSVLLDTWSELLARGFTDEGVALVWTQPWDGTTTLGPEELAPHFLEICRRVRCFEERGSIRCAYTRSKTKRSMAAVETGDVGDPWIPIGRSDGGALTIGPRGFYYDRLSHVLLGDEFKLAAAQKTRPEDGDPVWFVGAAFARGQGKTEGLHERILILPGEIRRRLGRPDSRAALGRRAAVHVERAKTMRQKVLYPSLRALAHGEKTVKDEFDAQVDDCFFCDLFGTVQLDDDEARLSWEKHLVELAQHELERAIERCVIPDAQRYRAISSAEALFWGCLKRAFPDALASSSTDAQSATKGGE